MAYTIRNFATNNDAQIIAQAGQFSVLQWDRDLSVSPANAQDAWFASQMNVRRRQLICDLNGHDGVMLQAGAMQWMAGSVKVTTGVKGAGDFIGKLVRGAVSQDTAIKPEYVGVGTVVCEPTWSYIMLIDLAQWGSSVVLDDGVFLACDAHLKHSLQRRTNFTSAAAGNEGLWNLRIDGTGIVALEIPCPPEELLFVDLANDELKIDGNYAIAWSSTLDFSVERSGKTLVGSAVSGEGLVNTYRGTGSVMMAPMQPATRFQTNAALPTD